MFDTKLLIEYRDALADLVKKTYEAGAEPSIAITRRLDWATKQCEGLEPSPPEVDALVTRIVEQVKQIDALQRELLYSQHECERLQDTINFLERSKTAGDRREIQRLAKRKARHFDFKPGPAFDGTY